MDKKYLGLVVVLFFVLFSTITYAVTDCLESDDGLSYYTKGSVYQVEGTDVIESSMHDDECSLNNNNLLLEYYCDGLDIKDTLYTCAYGCNGGACNPAPNSCQYYDYDFSPPAGPVSGCSTGFTCCLDNCIACGNGETVCCSKDGTNANCYDFSAGELCLEDGSIRQTDCDDPSDFNYCNACDFCSDGILNDGSNGTEDCGETCIDGGGSCVSQNAETFIEYVPVFEIGEIYHMSGNTNYISSLSMMFSNSVFCYDNIDNDNDCFIDELDTDCSFVPSTCIDVDGDGYGVGSGCLGSDCDDTDDSIHVNCDTTPPEVSIVINDDEIYTNNATVILNLTYYDADSGIAPNGCMFSSDGVFDTETWEHCIGIKSWILEGGSDGTRTVYVQIKDNDGNVNDTESDSIILDTTVPNIVVESPSDPSYDTQWIWFNVTATDVLSGVDQCFFSINDTLNTTMFNDTIDHYHFFNKSVYVGNYEVIFYCNDSVGNMGNVTLNLDVQYDCMLNEDLDPECRTVKLCRLNHWITDPDFSVDACCCISSGYWDNVELCCDSSDDWLTSDGMGVCSSGVIRGNYTGPTCNVINNSIMTDVDIVFVCNEIEINGTKNWWNGTYWVEVAPSYCGCTQNSDCDTLNNELCMGNICLSVKNPVVFINDMNTVHFGETTEFIIEIINEMNVSDNIELTLSGLISNWIWFDGKKFFKPHNMIVSVPPQSSKKIIVNVFGGQMGVYDLNIYVHSLLTLKDKTADTTINIIDVEDSLGTRIVNTPGLSGISFILVMLFGLVIMYFRKP
ncbi:MAG: hypothetical protein GQ477_03180 [Nanohaloarchaea archaeon]|nr:hypothetical protein [Candidatus Nanohaloarchaea archaeon]